MGDGRPDWLPDEGWTFERPTGWCDIHQRPLEGAAVLEELGRSISWCGDREHLHVAVVSVGIVEGLMAQSRLLTTMAERCRAVETRIAVEELLQSIEAPDE